MKCKECGNPRTKKVRKIISEKVKEEVKKHELIFAVCPKGHKYDMEA